jgi:hypothetical protein
MSAVYLHQIGEVVLLAGTGVIASVVHSFLKKDSWSKSVNNGIAMGYAAIIAALDLWLKGNLVVNNLPAAFLAVYGAAQAWYATLFLVSNTENKTSDLPVNTTP